MPKRKKPSDEPPPQETTSKEEDLSHSVLGGLKDPTLNSRLSGTEPDDQGSGITHFKIPFGEKAIVCERQQPSDSTSTETPPALIFTHGAGGGIANPATKDFARGFGSVEPVVCFQGTMNLVNRVKTFHTVIEDQGKGGKVALGGRSMGARAAVLTALEMEDALEALILVSWPLTAGKEGKREPERREKILKDLPESTDVLFIVGDKDVQCDLGMLEEVRGEMKARSWVVVVKGADHGMSLKEKDGVKDVRMEMGRVAAEWLRERDRERRRMEMGWDEEKGEVNCGGWKKVE